MIFWIIISILFVYCIGYITSSWNSSRKLNLQNTTIVEQEQIIDYMKSQIKELNLKIKDLNVEIKEIEKKYNSYPTYDKKA